MLHYVINNTFNTRCKGKYLGFLGRQIVNDMLNDNT